MLWKRSLPRACNAAWWLGASLYFGGMVTIGAIVAPAVFSTSRSANISMPGIVSPPLNMPNQVGGEIFGACLNRFAWIEVISLGLMLLGLAGAILAHRHLRRSTWILLLLWIVLATCVGYDSASLRPSVWSLRTDYRASAANHVPLTTTAPAIPWPEQSEFETLHHRSETLGRIKAYLLLAMILTASWRALADKKPN